MFKLAIAFTIVSALAASYAAAETAKPLKCVGSPKAGMPKEAVAIYKKEVAIEEPDRIRTLNRDTYWLVFQGRPLMNEPMEGAHHLAKVRKCDGLLMPVPDDEPQR